MTEPFEEALGRTFKVLTDHGAFVVDDVRSWDVADGFLHLYGHDMTLLAVFLGARLLGFTVSDD